MSPTQLSERRRTFYVSSIFVLATIFLFWRTGGYQFIVVDDHEYVYENSMVLKGLTWAGIKWAFTTLRASNWQPVTWMAHMLDCSLYGLFAGGHHLTSAAFHLANIVLLFLVLKKITGAFWPSAFVAALFGWHPMHVESAAWICERKDLLSMFFMVLTIWAYARYAEKPTAGKYLAALALFALGLMSKPMVVTLPCVLLLLDYWPLNRMMGATWQAKSSNTQGLQPTAHHPSLTALILEKIPFLALSAASSVITIIAQRRTGAMQTLKHLSLPERAIDAISAYGAYLEKAVWPTHLSVFYPLPASPQWGLFAFSIIALAVISVLAFRMRFTAPWLLVGWLWFLGTLVPVIGVVQVGNQLIADRYTYIPYIGLFIMVAWSGAALLKRLPSLKPLLAAAASVAVIACVVLTSIQLSYWHDSIRLFTHALQVTKSNAFSEANLSFALSKAGRGREAIPHYEALLNFTPGDVKARYNLGLELTAAGEPAKAAGQFSEALKYQPDSDKLHNSLGVALSQQGKLDAAAAEFQKAIQLNPRFLWPYLNYAVIRQRQGHAADALTNYNKALNLMPDWAETLDKLAFLFATCPDAHIHDPAKAIQLATQANDLTGRNSPDLLRTLAIAYAAAGDFSNAVTTAQLALDQARLNGVTNETTEISGQLSDYQAGKNPPLDWKSPPESGIIRK